MNETELSQKCQIWIKKHGGHVLKIHGNNIQRTGEPDLIGGIRIDGTYIPFAIELKVGKNKPTRLQRHRLHQWATKAGYATGVAYSLSDFIRIIVEHDKN